MRMTGEIDLIAMFSRKFGQLRRMDQGNLEAARRFGQRPARRLREEIVHVIGACKVDPMAIELNAHGLVDQHFDAKILESVGHGCAVVVAEDGIYAMPCLHGAGQVFHARQDLLVGALYVKAKIPGQHAEVGLDARGKVAGGVHSLGQVIQVQIAKLKNLKAVEGWRQVGEPEIKARQLNI